MSSTFSDSTRNFPRPGHVSVGEGQHQNNSRLSESAPPRHHTPPPRRAGRTESPRPSSRPTSAQRVTVAPDAPSRVCSKCHTPKAYDSFVLLAESERTFGAVRQWCDSCLRASAFAKHRVVKSKLAAMIRARSADAAGSAIRAKAEAAMTHALTSNALALQMYDRAKADRTFAAALRLATTALDFPRAELEAVI